MPTKLLRKQFLLTDDENSKVEKEAVKAGVSVSNLTRSKYGLAPLKPGTGKAGNEKKTVATEQRGRRRSQTTKHT
jgi:hypothetical protein